MAGSRSVPVSRELRALGATLRTSAPYAVFGLALFVLALAYQARPSYSLTAGGPTDAPFWRRIYNGETNAATRATYRWTGPTTTLVLPGIGAGDYRVRLDLSGDRPAPYPPPDLLLSVPGVPPVPVRPSPGRHTYEVAVPASAVQDGDLRLTITTLDPFTPPNDARLLGVTVYGAQLDPVGSGPVLPPLLPTLLLAAAAGLVALMLGLAGWGPGVVRAGGLLFALAEAGFLVFDRLWLTPISGTLVGVMLTAGGLLLLLGPLWRALYRAGGIVWPELDQRWLLAIFAAAFVARLAGQLHPQAVVIDLVFHQHQLEKVLAGNLLFTIPSDEWGGKQTFYLPTPYVLMLPLQWLLNDKLLTIRVFGVLLDTLSVFLVYYLARRAFGDGRGGLLAAGLLVTFPLATLPFSWGITANLFGQFTGLAAVAVAVGLYDRLARPGPWLLLTALLCLALLSHPGSVQLTGLLFGGLLAVWLVGGQPSVVSRRWSVLGGRVTKSWLALLASLVGAIGIAWFGYYSHFAEAQLKTLAEIRQEKAAEQAKNGFSIKVGGEVNDYSLGLRQRIVRDRGTGFTEGILGFGAEAWAYFHAWPLLWAPVGFYVARRRRGGGGGGGRTRRKGGPLGRGGVRGGEARAP
ncbi:MAG: hypothetical protein ACR2M0_00005, partial [Chloroflexia bacterium]